MRFVIMTCVYNAEKYIAKCLNSVKNQTYKNFVHVVVDDASTDNTYREILKHEHAYARIYRNDKNIKWIRNALMYLNESLLSDEDVIVILDGDDWLAHSEVLNQVRAEYEDGAWMTYSLFQYPNGQDSSWIPRYTEQVMRDRLYRDVIWSFTHLRTFKAFLWKNLNKNDLKGPNGEYTPYTYDQALLFPMLEMCSYGKVRFIDEVLYVYNNENPLQVEKFDRIKQQALGRWFRSRPKYDVLVRHK